MELVSPGSAVGGCVLPQPVLAWGALHGTFLCADPPGELCYVPWDGWLPKPSSALAFGMVRAGPAAGFEPGSRFMETKDVRSALRRMHLADHKSIPKCTKALWTARKLLPWAVSFRDLCHTACVEPLAQAKPAREVTGLKSHARQG